MCVIRTYNLRNRNTSRTLSDKRAGKKPKSLDTRNLEASHGHISMPGKKYTNFALFSKAYAQHFKIESWKIPENIGRYLEAAFSKGSSFSSYKDITNQVIPQNEFLPRNPHFMDLSRECLIEMTGSRKKDKEQAEALNGNPNNWVWHHVEGLKLVGNNAYCNMVPAEPIFHSQRHIGAVKEYETIKSKKYKT